VNGGASEGARNGRSPAGAASEIVPPELTLVVLAAGGML
jgi:hypothetical protein